MTVWRDGQDMMAAWRPCGQSGACLDCGGTLSHLCTDKFDALIEAMGAKGISLHYQCQHAVPDDAPYGAEALLRVTGKSGKPIPPPIAVARAESAGLGSALAMWILEHAAMDSEELAAAGFFLPIRVNLQEDDILDPWFLENAMDILRQHPRVELELVETVRTDDVGRVFAGLDALIAAGAKIWMDDYCGDPEDHIRLTGPAGDQRRLFHGCKLDKTFMDLGREEGWHALREVVRSLEPYGANLIIEGVEDHDDLVVARKAGLGAYQGFHFHRPAPLADLITRLRDDADWSESHRYRSSSALIHDPSYAQAVRERPCGETSATAESCSACPRGCGSED